jgi:Tfp pilus assembly protein PilF
MEYLRTRPLLLYAALACASCGARSDPATEARRALARGDHAEALVAFDAAIAERADPEELLVLELDRCRALCYVGADAAADDFLALAEAHPRVGAREHSAMVRELIEAEQWTAARAVAEAARARFPSDANVLQLGARVQQAAARAAERARAPGLDPNISSNPYVGGGDD